MRCKHTQLSLKSKDASVNIGLVEKEARVIGQIAGGKIIRAIHNHIIALQKPHGIVSRQRMGMHLQIHMRVDAGERLPC